MRICLISREFAPVGGGGIGVYVNALAGVLREDSEVMVMTTEAHREAFELLSAQGDPRLPDGVDFRFLPEPDPRAVEHSYGYHQVWATNVLEALGECYGSRGPDLIEVPDYHAEGFALVQARLARHRSLAETPIVVRAHTSWEMCSLLDGDMPTDLPGKAMCAMERHVLRHADRLLWAGGDILKTYERFYGADALAPALQLRHPAPLIEPLIEPPSGSCGAGAGERLKLLYVGRLERRKGVLDLIRAFQRSAGERATLTLVGGDTETAPSAGSMHATLTLMTLGDERIEVLGAQSADRVAQLLHEHDVVVAPSRWECWPYSVLEALQADRPVLATRVGGHRELVRPGATGWLAEPGEDGIAVALESLLDEPGAALEMAVAGEGARSCRELTDPDAIRAAYRALAGVSPRPRPRRSQVEPLVSAIVPYKGMSAYVDEAVASLEAQTHPRIEIVVVCDGSFDAGDELLHELERRVPSLRVLWQSNRGLGGARNAGIVQSRGRYVFALDADNVAEPEFIARAVELLEDDPRLAYVTAWSRYIDNDGNDVLDDLVIGYQPLGNFTELVEETNVAGDAAAVWPRWLFDLGFRYDENVPVIEDWTLYRKMRKAGLYGCVIPERLVRYRIRADSMYQVETGRVGVLREQATAELALGRVAWS